MNELINQLIDYGLTHQMIDDYDVDYVANKLLDVLHQETFERQETKSFSIYETLEQLLDEAVERGLIEDTIDSRDLFDTRIMDCLMPRPSEVIKRFNDQYAQSPKKATDDFYQLSIHSNYIRKSRVDKNIVYTSNTRYGDLIISINLSKPEKDPRDIAKAKLIKASGYPQCLLCKENVGYAGTLSHPARQTHRIIPIDFDGERYYFQYSPYVYYNEHCIILNEHHEPMVINTKTFKHLLDFIDRFPHYMLGSNADLPIVGGSILTHDHYQGGSAHFPIEDARIINTYQIKGYEDVKVDMIEWPLSTLRLTSQTKESIVNLSSYILDQWIAYSDPKRHILAYSHNTRHNTITPIARFVDGSYQMDLVLRNNRTTAEHPLGIFHPHEEYHHIKKENIGLIEVMGLAILPGRLKHELELMEQCLKKEANIDDYPELDKHRLWFDAIKDRQSGDIAAQLKDDLADIFMHVLENAGVFKMDQDGIKGFHQFVLTL